MNVDDERGLPGDDRLELRLWASAALNGAITLAEFLGGIFSGSLALLSDAAHNLGDVAAVVLALWARRFGRRPPTERHTYGFRRAEVLAALANAVALVANLGSVLLLRRHDRDDVNVRGAYLHMSQDALASLAVVVAALLARTRVGAWVDPAAALVVGAAVLRSALSLAWETLSTLLEGAPVDADLAAMAADVRRAFPAAAIHHVHLWQNGPGQRLLTAHVTLEGNPDGAAIEVTFAGIKDLLRENWAVTHATLEPEVEGCGETALLGRWEGEGT